MKLLKQNNSVFILVELLINAAWKTHKGTAQLSFLYMNNIMGIRGWRDLSGPRKLDDVSDVTRWVTLILLRKNRRKMSSKSRLKFLK
jgi:hypothetical protein